MQQLSNDEAMRLIREGAEALQRGRSGEARTRFEAVTATGRANAQIWLLLATACKMEGDVEAEEAAVDGLLALEPRLTRALLQKGDCRARLGDERAAMNFYKSALMNAQATTASGQRLPDDVVAELRRAETALAEMEARVDAQREASLTLRGLPPGTRSPRFQQSLDISAGRKRIFVSEPTGYYFPGLPQIQFFDTAQFDWVPQIEAATADILAELTALLAAGTQDFRPYIVTDTARPRLDDNPLLDSPDWSARFLVENGTEVPDTIARCPRTWAALQSAPLPNITNSPTAMFSLLRPGARINPHTGMFNTRLICHLPLIVPPGCGFRVGNEVREWEVGKLLIFDDTIEHEAWNHSAQDRVVLIFDIWRPELTEQEREEIAALFAGPTVEQGRAG